MAGIYIHIPFCKQACSYCDFHFSTQLKNKTEIVSALLKEIELRRSYLDEPVDSIYFGGGTPSLLNASEINLLIEKIHNYFEINNSIEITLEANPDDLSKTYLKELNSTSINRLSVGIQSFNDEELEFMNRAHNAKMAKEAILNSQDAGFSNLTVDLIFGNPLSNLNSWEESLNTFFSLNIPHLSAYSLTVEKGTKLYHDIQKGKIINVSDELSYKQYKMLQEKINISGFEQYEVSNYCKDENYAKHNSSYWNGTKYLGIGPSAHSFNGISRQWNIRNNPLYLKEIENGSGYFEVEHLTEVEQYHELLLTSLRTKWGLNLNKLENSFSTKIVAHFEDKIKNVKNQTTLDHNHLRMKPEFLFESDAIIRELMI